METGIQAYAKRCARVIFRLDGSTLTPDPRLLFDVSYHPRLGVSRQSCNKDSRSTAPFSFLGAFESSACRFESTETTFSGDSVRALPLFRACRPRITLCRVLGVAGCDACSQHFAATCAAMHRRTSVTVSARRQAGLCHCRRSPVHLPTINKCLVCPRTL